MTVMRLSKKEQWFTDHISVSFEREKGHSCKAVRTVFCILYQSPKPFIVVIGYENMPKMLNKALKLKRRRKT